MKHPFQITAKRRQGRCYELAFRGILESADVVLVHGEVSNPDGARIDHAWLAGDDFVYDPVLDRCFAPGDYHARFATLVYATYTQREAAAWAAKTRHSGPWHDADAPAADCHATIYLAAGHWHVNNLQHAVDDL